MFRDVKRGLSYSNFHREISKNVEDVCPKRLENRLESRIGRTASGERDHVKHKSYVTGYVKKCENVEVRDAKAGDICSDDQRIRQSGVRQIDDKHTGSSLSNTSTSSSLWTDESSTDSSIGLFASPPFNRRVNHTPLQYYLTSSNPRDCPQACDPPSDTSLRDLQFHQNPRGTAFLQNYKKYSEIQKTQTFLSPSKHERVISRNLEKLEERIQNPRVHSLFGKQKHVAVFVPGIVSQKEIIGLSNLYDSKVLLAERVAESNRKEFLEELAYGQSSVLDYEAADGNKTFFKRSNFLSAKKNRSCLAPPSRKSESSLCMSRTLDRKSTETLPKQSVQKPVKAVSGRARIISPFHRLSFSIGKSRKNSNAKGSQTPPHLSTTFIPSRVGLDNRSTSCTSTATRGRSSPLRRLLDPLIRPKSSYACRSPEPSLKGAHQKHILSDGHQYFSTLLSRKRKTSTVQALFRVTSKNDQPLFTFAVDKEQSITTATIRKQIAPENEECEHKYTFFTVQEVEKENGKGMNHGRKVQSQEYTSNIVAQMRVSCSKPLSSVDSFLTKEFVLCASESQRTNELDAMVVKIPTTLGDYFADVNATMVLPSGIHSLPHKGKPSSLIQKWKSGGSCECGGWDTGCNLRILTNQFNKPRNLSASTSDALKIFFQGNNKQPLSFTPYKEGVYAVEYNTSLSLFQAFSICIAVNEGQSPVKKTKPNTSCVDNGDVSSTVQSESWKPFSGSVEAEAETALREWIVTVEETLEFKGVPLDQCVPLIAMRFCGRAKAWWTRLKTSRARLGKPKISSWDKLKEKMLTIQL